MAGFALVAPTEGLATPPANDAFANAFQLSGLAAAIDGASNAEATSEPGEPAIHDGGGRSVWWRWTAPGSAGVTIRACSSDMRPTFGVYEGDAPDALRVVGDTGFYYFTGRGASKTIPGSCASGPVVSFFARAGQTYRIAVSGVFQDVGTFNLRLTPSAYADVAVEQSPDGPVARFVYRASAGAVDGVSLDLGVLEDENGVPAFPDPSFWGRWPGAAGPGCSPSGSVISFCAIPAGATAGGPRITLGDRDDIAQIAVPVRARSSPAATATI